MYEEFTTEISAVGNLIRYESRCHSDHFDEENATDQM